MEPTLGTKYTNKSLMSYFKVGVSSGIRIIKGKQGLLLILDISSKKPHKGHRTYDDYFSNDGEYLYYFGINSKRDPRYYTANNELRAANELNKNNRFPLYLIIYTGPNHYFYADRLHYTNKFRPVGTNWLFKLTAKDPSHNIRNNVQHVIEQSINMNLHDFSKNNRSNNGHNKSSKTPKKNFHNKRTFVKHIMKRVKSINNHHGSSTQHKRHKNGYHTKAYEYYRGGLIREYSKIVANGHCQNCGRPAPFIDYSTGWPYLESHHIIPRHNDGPDTVDNIIALCPNCHRMMHSGFSEHSPKLLEIRHKLHAKAVVLAKKYGIDK